MLFRELLFIKGILYLDLRERRLQTGAKVVSAGRRRKIKRLRRKTAQDAELFVVAQADRQAGVDIAAQYPPLYLAQRTIIDRPYRKLIVFCEFQQPSAVFVAVNADPHAVKFGKIIFRQTAFCRRKKRKVIHTGVGPRKTDLRHTLLCIKDAAEDVDLAPFQGFV